MSKNIYMHLIDGKPAMYEPNQQIVFVNRYNKVPFERMFVGSLETIKRQQKASREWRKKCGYSDGLPNKYGYLRIQKPEES